MNARARQPCELALDADEILTAHDEGIEGLDALGAARHVAQCEQCREVVRLREKARSAWAATKTAPAVKPEESELRRVYEGRTAKPANASRGRVPAIAFAAATPFAIAAAVVAIVTHRPPEPAANPHATSSVAVTAPAAPSGEPTTSAATPVAATPQLPPAKAARRGMTVPEGSRVMLGFAIGIGSLDPDGSAELVGPASATATDTSLTVERGTVRVRGLRNVTVIVPGARLDPNGSTCTVTVDERGVARLDVQTGRAMILGRSGGLVTVESGGAMQLDPDGSLRVPQPPAPRAPVSEEEKVRPPALSVTAAVPPPAPTTTTPEGATPGAKPPSSAPGKLAASPDDALSEARSRMRNGDTAAARADLEQLAASADARVSRRASFTLAEMDLAAGDREKARVRLERLVVCPEPALGADAATLLARTLPAAERAVVWKRYLATNPPRPYFERALLDRAEALLDSGRGAEARALLDEVKHSPSLTESHRRQLDRLLFKARELQ